MPRIPKVDQLIYKLDNSIETALRIMPGQSCRVRTQNAFGRSFCSTAEFEKFFEDQNSTIRSKLSHPCTGPIEIVTDRSNISLEVFIQKIEAKIGYQCISRSTGLLPSRFPERLCSILELRNGNEVPMRNEDLVIHTHPKIGFIATLDQETRSCGRACENGGNIDLNYLDEGSYIYLPVNDRRARLVLGDLHLCQGNGEAAGVGIEADGEITLRVRVVDKINFPIILDWQRVVIVGWGESLSEALICATENGLQYLERVFPFFDWPEAERYKFLSAEGNFEMGNCTGAIKTCGLVILRSRLFNRFGFAVQ